MIEESVRRTGDGKNYSTKGSHLKASRSCGLERFLHFTEFDLARAADVILVLLYNASNSDFNRGRWYASVAS